jgi:microsomal dipeptidase-like Zn-dependent dipeptidase
MVDPDMINDTDHLVLPDLNEIERIHRYGGTLGMILMNYWQDGQEQQSSLFVNDPGIQNVIATMKEIKEMTGDVSCISIGSDLDGFTTVPSDLPHVSYMNRLRQAIEENFSEEEADDIFFGNALRVLRAGWS